MSKCRCCPTPWRWSHPSGHLSSESLSYQPSCCVSTDFPGVPAPAAIYIGTHFDSLPTLLIIMHCWWGCCEAVGGLFLGCFTFNPFIGINVASDCSSNTGDSVASWLLVVIQCSLHQCLPPRPSLPTPVLAVLFPLIPWTPSWSVQRSIPVSWCVYLSVLLCLSSLDPCSWNLWGRGVFCWWGIEMT